MSLFNEFDVPTERGRRLSADVMGVMRPLIEAAVEEGHPSYEVEHIVLNTITLICAEGRLRRSVRLRASGREVRLLQRQAEERNAPDAPGKDTP